MSLTAALSDAILYADKNGVTLPPALRVRARRIGAIKAGGDIDSIAREYQDAILDALVTYFESGGSITAPKAAFNRAMVDAFGAAFDMGWADGGAEGVPEGDALEWFNARVSEEFAFIEELFIQAKDLRKEEDFDFVTWTAEKSESYAATVKDIYNRGALYGGENIMLTFEGEDGDANHICQSIGGTCVRLKGQRHKASWWISHDLIPYRGNKNFDCGGWNCQHYLVDDKGNRFTI